MLSYCVVSVVLYKINKANVKRCALFFSSFDCIMSGAWEQHMKLASEYFFSSGVFTRCSCALNKSLKLKT